MIKKLLPSLGWVFLGLLLVAGMLISAGRNEVAANPRADSFAPSGSAALFALLSSRGYRVEIDRSPHPKLEAGDVAIAFQLASDNPLEAQATADQDADIENSLAGSARQGAIVIGLPLKRDFQSATAAATVALNCKRPDSRERLVTDGGADRQGIPVGDDSVTPLSILAGPNGTFTSATRSGIGYVIDYNDGLGLTNRFIDKGDNAQAFMETLRGFAPPGARVVFTEAAFGNVEQPGLLETIGSWAEGAWYQLIFLFVVIIYSLNRRFGLPEQYRAKQKGTRELLDAVTDTFVRARAGSTALQAASAECNARLRSSLKLPRDAGMGELYRVLPESLINALTRVRAASEMQSVPPQEAFALIQKLDSELDAFLAVRDPRMVKRKARPKAA